MYQQHITFSFQLNNKFRCRLGIRSSENTVRVFEGGMECRVGEREMQINLLSYMHRAYNLWWQIKRCWGCRITRTHTNGHTLYLMHTRAYSQTSSRKQKMINWIKCNSHWPCFALRLRMQFVALYDCHLIPDSTATYLCGRMHNCSNENKTKE